MGMDRHNSLIGSEVWSEPIRVLPVADDGVLFRTIIELPERVNQADNGLFRSSVDSSWKQLGINCDSHLNLMSIFENRITTVFGEDIDLVFAE